MSRRTPVLTESTPTRQIGIRQRSLVGRCRLGRATELVFILATGAALVLAGGAMAQVLRWDPDAAAGVQGGSGTWDASNDNWTSDAGVTNIQWVDGNSARFEASPGTVTVIGNHEVDDIIVISGGYEIGGAGTLELVGTPSVADIFVGTSLVISAEVTGTAPFEKSGGGILTLTGDNSYSGGTTITDGTLQVGDGGTSGTLGTGAVTNNSALVFNRSDAVTVGNEISGSGTLEQAGSGTLTLTGDNSYTGGTTINAGAIEIEALDGVGTGDVEIATDAALRLIGGDDFTFDARDIFGGGTLEVTGSGEVTLGTTLNVNLNNSGTGSVISAGTITGSVTNSGGELAYDAPGDVNLGDSSGMFVTGTIDGSVTNTDGVFAAAGNLSITGDVTNSAGARDGGTGDPLRGFGIVPEDAGFVPGTYTMTIGGTLTNEDGGLIIVGEGSTLRAASISNLDGGEIEVQAGATLHGTGNTFNNSGLVTVGNGGTLSDATAYNNLGTGEIVFDDGDGGTQMTFDAPDITNIGEIRLDAGDLAVNGTFTNESDDGDDGQVLLQGGDVTFNMDVTNKDSATFTIANGTTTIDNGDGTFANSDDATLEIESGAALTANLTNADDGTVVSEGIITGTIVNTGGAVTYDGAGDVTGATGMFMSGTINGDVTNTSGVFIADGALTIDGSVSNSAGALDGDDNVTELFAVGDGGHTVEVTGDFENTGIGIAVIGDASTLQVNGALTNAGQFEIDSDATLVGDLDNSGFVFSEGTISGALTNSGTVVSEGTITGNITNTGGLLAYDIDGNFDPDSSTGMFVSGTVNGDVNNNAGVFAAAGDLTITGTVNNRAGAFNLDGDPTQGFGVVPGGFTLTIGEDLNNDGGSNVVVGEGSTIDVSGIVNNDGNILIDEDGTFVSGTMNNNGFISLLDGASLQGTGNTLNNNSLIEVGNGADLTYATAINNNEDGAIIFDDEGGGDEMTLAAPTITNEGMIELDNGSLAVNGSFTNQAEGEVFLDGNTSFDSDVTNTDDAEFTIASGTTTIAGGAGTFANSGAALLQIDSGAGLTGNLTNADDGTVESEGTITGNIVNTGGTVTYDGAGDVTGATGMFMSGTINGDVTNTSGVFIADGALTIDGSVSNSAGALDGDDNVTELFAVGDGGHTVEVTGDFENTGTGIAVIGDDSTLQVNGALTNAGQFEIDSGATLAGDLDNSGFVFSEGTISGALTNSGTVVSEGTITGNITNTGGLLAYDIDGNFDPDSSTGMFVSGTVDGDVNNNAGVFAAAGDLTITGTVNNRAGAFDLDGNPTEGFGVVPGGAELTINGNLNNIVDGADRGAVVVGEGSTITIEGIFENDGDVLIAEGSTLEAATLNSNAGADIQVGANATLRTTGNTYNNAGLLDVFTNGTVESVASDVNNLGTGTINFNGPGGTATLSAAGEISNAGAINLIDGGLDVFGPFTNEATGTVTLDGDDVAFDGNVTNTDGATFTLDSGNLDIGGDLVTSGSSQMTLDGGDVTIDGDVTVTDGSTFDLDDGELDIAGTVTVGGTAVMTLDGGDVTLAQTLDVTGGSTFELASGALSVGDDVSVTDGGTVLLGGGNVIMNGGLTTNGGATFELNSGTLDIAGDVANSNSGTILLDGGDVEIGGELTNTDGGQITLDDGALDIALDLNNSGSGQIMFNGGDVTIGGDVTNQNDASFSIVSGTTTIGAGGSGTFSNEDDAVLDIGNGATLNAALENAATATIDGTLDGTLLNSDNTTTIGATGQVTGDTTITDGTVTNEGTMADVANGPDGTFVNLAGGVAGDVTNEGTGSNDGQIASLGNSGGFSNTDTITGDANNSGTLTNTGTIGGNVTNTDTLNHNAGTIGGTLTNDAGTSTVAGGASVTGLTTVNDGVLNVSAGGALNAGLTVNDGEANNSGTITGPVTVDGGELNTDGTITGLLTNNALTNAEGTITGNVINNATMTVTGNLGGIGTFTNNELLTLVAGTTTTAASFVNDGDIVALGSVTLTGNLTNEAGSTISTLTGNSGDIFLVNGNVSGSTRLLLNADLTDLDAGTSDLFRATGTMGGDLNVDFTTIGGLELQSNRIEFVRAESGFAGGFDLQSVTGLPTGGLLDVVISQDANSIGMQVLPSTSLGGVAGTLGSVQAIIGSVVNRPSSPFVSRVLFEPEGGCTPGGWARGIMGGATSSTSTAFGDTGVNVPSTSRLRYRGLQGGFDVSCIDDGPGGLEYAFGVSFGQNTGSTRQDRFEFNPITNEVDLDAPLSPITGSFTQRYGAVYAVAERDNWAGDLQLRREHTSLTFNNADLELDNSKISTRGTTLSGSVTYFHAMDNGFTLAPTAGFAVTRTGSGTLTFGDPDDPTATLTADAHTSKVGFVGMSLARSQVNEEAQSATTGFMTATLYNDFARARTTNFGLGGGGGETTELSTRNLGAFGEFSVGMSYVKLFNGGAGAPRQLTATVRGDARFSNRLESYGLTAQVRLNF